MSFYSCYIDAISPAQAMRKHNMPKRLNINEQIIINITPLVREKDDIPLEVHRIIDHAPQNIPSVKFPNLSPQLEKLKYPSEDQLQGMTKKTRKPRQKPKIKS